MLDQKFDTGQEVCVVNPGNKLLAACRRATKAEPYKTKQHSEDAATIWTRQDCAAECNLTSVWSVCFEARSLPSARARNTELPLGRRIGLVAANLSCLLVHRP